MISIQNLTVKFGSKPVLCSLSHTFASGEVHGIIGLNGAGKSTFFNVLTEVVQPESGEILFGKEPLKRNHIGYLETNNFFYANLTGREYLNIFPKTNFTFDLTVFEKLLMLPLDNLIANYSTGMKKKLALLAILKQDKPIYIFDEPFNGLDLEANRTLELIIQSLQGKNKTVFLASHVLEPLLHTCHQIHLLERGRFVKSFVKTEFNTIRDELFRHLEKDVQTQLNQAL